jgi:hypothetical protein
MLETILLQVTLGKLLSYGFLLAIGVFIYVVIRFSSNKENKFHIIDTISNPDGTASLTRILQFSAGVTATWVIIKFTVAGTLGTEMFGVYLAAMGISEGFTKYLQSKGTK